MMSILSKVFKKQIVLLVFSGVSLVGCATYDSAFSCGDAKGANCTSMDRVYTMIESGEIERFNESRKKKQSRGRGKNRVKSSSDILLEPVVHQKTPTYFTKRGQEE